MPVCSPRPRVGEASRVRAVRRTQDSELFDEDAVVPRDLRDSNRKAYWHSQWRARMTRGLMGEYCKAIDLPVQSIELSRGSKCSHKRPVVPSVPPAQMLASHCPMYLLKTP